MTIRDNIAFGTAFVSVPLFDIDTLIEVSIFDIVGSDQLKNILINAVELVRILMEFISFIERWVNLSAENFIRVVSCIFHIGIRNVGTA